MTIKATPADEWIRKNKQKDAAHRARLRLYDLQQALATCASNDLNVAITTEGNQIKLSITDEQGNEVDHDDPLGR